MYDVSLINLAADAHAAADSLVKIERRGMTDAELRILLKSFTEIDAVDNAVVSPEIHVRHNNERFLISTGQKKLMLYEVDHRERPALVLTLEEAMAELDGTAEAARNASIARQPQTGPADAGVMLPPLSPVVAASKPRLAVMSVLALALVCAITYLHWGTGSKAVPASFLPVDPAEAASLQAELGGVYLTGVEPGSHGIVVTPSGDLKLFELGAVAAPRVVYASARIGRVDSQLTLATDQPGGLIEVTDRNALVYCGEVYRRVP